MLLYNLTGKMTYFKGKAVYYNKDEIQTIQITNYVEKEQED